MADGYSYVPQHYTAGNYLHRLYLAKNPLIADLSLTGGFSRAQTELENAYNDLFSREDQMLASFAQQYGAGTSADDGMQFLKNLLAGSETALKEVIDVVKNYVEQSSGKIDFNDEGVRTVIIEGVKSIMEDKKFSKTPYETSLQQGYEELYQQLIDGLDQLAGDTPRITESGKKVGKDIKNAYAFEGFIHELVVTGLFNINLVDYVNSNQTTLRSDIMEIFQNMAVEAAAKAVGDTSVASKVKTNGKFSQTDMSIPLSDFGANLNIQLKAKPTSSGKNTNIILQTSTPMEDLISDNIQGADRLAIKTALINQHFWGLGEYKEQVKKVVSKSPEMSGAYGNLSSARPTALERLDYSTTLDVLHPVIPVLEQAIFYNVVTGIAKEMEAHLYVVTDRSGYAIMRSSSILAELASSGHSEVNVTRKGNVIGTKIKGLDNLKGSGRLSIQPKSTQLSNVTSAFKKGGSHERWYNAISSITDAAYNNMAVTLTFNYANQISK